MRRSYLFQTCLSLGLLSGCTVNDPVSGVGNTGGSSETPTQAPQLCPELVHTGDVTANDPAAIAGLVGVTRIAGSLILDAGALGDLESLRCLRHVEGELTLRGNENRRFSGDVLAPLASLQHVGGALTVDQILGLSRVSLRGLQTVGGDFRVINLPDLLDLQGLEKLTQVQGQLMVARNAQLVHLEGLKSVGQAAEVLILENPSLQRLGGFGPLVQTGRLKFSRNPKLQNLGGLDSIAQVQALVLEDNDELVDIRALGRLAKVELELLIVGNAKLASLQGLESLAQVPPRFDIEDNTVLASLDGLKALAAPADPKAKMSIVNNPALERLGPWQHWVQGSGSLHIANNPVLGSLAGLENLKTIGALTLHGPDRLADLQGLTQLNKVERRLSVGGREQWISIAGLPALTDVGELEVVGMNSLSDLSRFASVPSIGGLRLFSLPKLTNLSAFSSISHLKGDLWLDDLAVLSNLAGLERLTEIQGRLVLSKVNQVKHLSELTALRKVGTMVIANNAQLLDLDGLSGITTLTQIEGGLCVHQNPVMTQMDALSGLTKVEGSVTFTENPALETMQGVSELVEIGASLWIDGSPKVKTLEPFAKLLRIGGRAWSFDDTCPAILAPRDQQGPVPQPHHGFMGIEVRMMNVENLKGFQNLETIRGGISIKENPLLTNLSDMFGVRVEGVTVEVRRNPKMEQCHALSIMKNLAFFDGGDIRIWDNLGEDEPNCD